MRTSRASTENGVPRDVEPHRVGGGGEWFAPLSGRYEDHSPGATGSPGPAPSESEWLLIRHRTGCGRARLAPNRDRVSLLGDRSGFTWIITEPVSRDSASGTSNGSVRVTRTERRYMQSRLGSEAATGVSTAGREDGSSKVCDHRERHPRPQTRSCRRSDSGSCRDGELCRDGQSRSSDRGDGEEATAHEGRALPASQETVDPAIAGCRVRAQSGARAHRPTPCRLRSRAHSSMPGVVG